MLNLPVWQLSPPYPSTHVQLYPLTESVQLPEFWQGSLAHSSISARRNGNTVDVHYSDVIMSMMASQITSVSMVCSTVCSGEDQRKHKSSASLAFAMGIHQWSVNSPHKGPVTRKMFLWRHHGSWCQQSQCLIYSLWPFGSIRFAWMFWKLCQLVR